VCTYFAAVRRPLHLRPVSIEITYAPRAPRNCTPGRGEYLSELNWRAQHTAIWSASEEKAPVAATTSQAFHPERLQQLFDSL